jgi:G3E family GTPase
MIPLVLLAGFLGAGKTRLLTSLIPQLTGAGLRVRVILNDFRNARIDAARLGALEALVTPLNGECVCCGSLRELLDHLYEVPAETGSVMLVEANGATETDELLGHLTTDARLAHYTLPLQLTVVDVVRWQKRWWHNGLERAQVVTATHLHLNWLHRCDAARQAFVREALHAINPRATMCDVDLLVQQLVPLARGATGDAAVHPRVAGASAAPRDASTPADRTPSPGHAHPFASMALPLPHEVDRARFTTFVESLPESVVRAKGLVRFRDAEGPMYVWNRVPGSSAMTLDASWPHADAEPVALFIGVGMPVAELREALARLGEAYVRE